MVIFYQHFGKRKGRELTPWKSELPAFYPNPSRVRNGVVTIVTEYDWESDSWTHPTGEHAARAAWREAIQVIAERAKATLPECHSRVDAAVKLVLAGDVALLEDDKATVASQSNGQMVYHVVDGECSCKDYAKAPSYWCKHVRLVHHKLYA
jgi:hypothetical protein